MSASDPKRALMEKDVDQLVKSSFHSRKFVDRTPILFAHARIDSHREIALNEL